MVVLSFLGIVPSLLSDDTYSSVNSKLRGIDGSDLVPVDLVLAGGLKSGIN